MVNALPGGIAQRLVNALQRVTDARHGVSRCNKKKIVGSVKRNAKRQSVYRIHTYHVGSLDRIATCDYRMKRGSLETQRASRCTERTGTTASGV